MRVSMRPVGEIFMHDLKIVFVIEFVGRKDAELVSGFEQGDGNHEDAGKAKMRGFGRVQDPVPCEKPPSGAGQSRSMAPQRTGDGRDHREAEGASGGSLLADPDSGLIDGDPDMVQDAIHKERDWFCFGGN